jgi:hypothetical protein
MPCGATGVHDPHNWADGGFGPAEYTCDGLGELTAVRVYDRAEVEARMDANKAKIERFAMRGVVIDSAELVMTRLKFMCDRIFGDMDTQSRLAFESDLADEYAGILAATEVKINQALIAQGPISPGGIILPHNGR